VKTREEALAEVEKFAEEYRQLARKLRDEGLSKPAIARAMNISDDRPWGLSAIQKVENVLKERR
jgi:hypothetical protein